MMENRKIIGFAAILIPLQISASINLVSVPGQGDRQRHYPEAREDSQRLRKGFLGETDWPKLITAAGRLSDAPIWIAALSPFFTDKIWRRTYC